MRTLTPNMNHKPTNPNPNPTNLQHQKKKKREERNDDPRTDSDLDRTNVEDNVLASRARPLRGGGVLGVYIGIMR